MNILSKLSLFIYNIPAKYFLLIKPTSKMWFLTTAPVIQIFSSKQPANSFARIETIDVWVGW